MGIEAMEAWLILEVSKVIHLWPASETADLIPNTGTAQELAEDWVAANITFPRHKPPASVSIDDRCITFTGQWPDLETLKNFRPWNKDRRKGERRSSAMANDRRLSLNWSADARGGANIENLRTSYTSRRQTDRRRS